MDASQLVSTINVSQLHSATFPIRLRTMPHLLGYARVSTADQHPDLQLDALKAAGCYRIFADTGTGALDERPELTKVLDHVRPGDTLVVWKLDRLGRSLRHLIDTITDLQQRSVGFRSLQEQIDTTTPGGKSSSTSSVRLRSSSAISSGSARWPVLRQHEPAAAQEVAQRV